MYKGDDIKRLIPQRNPFIMVDTFEERDGDNAVTSLAVRHDNFFILPDGTLAETGLIEHIAQSCSALAGCQVLSKGGAAPPVGIIGEIKHFVCQRRPHPGELITTSISFNMTFGNITLATGKSMIDDELIAEVRLTIFIQ